MTILFRSSDSDDDIDDLYDDYYDNEYIDDNYTTQEKGVNNNMTQPEKKSEAIASKKPKIKRKIMKPNDFVNIYAVYNSTDTSHKHPIAFTATREEALQAIDQFVFYKHFAHFKHWCPLHNLPINRGSSWDVYCDNVLAEQCSVTDTGGDYIIVEYHYTRQDIASILRMFTLCTPLAVGYEFEEEYTYYEEMTKNNKPTDLDAAINDVAKTFAELEKEENNNSSFPQA